MSEEESPTSGVECGMKLEALDRLNPNLVCVATIADIAPDGKLLIHFDGWGNDYDYWAEPGCPDLHPLGYMEEVGSASGKYSPAELQPPLHHDEDFTWFAYLKATSSKPVPYHFFTEEQRAGTKPDKTLAAYAELLQNSAEETEKEEEKSKPVATQGGNKSLVSVGMRLEAVDRQNPGLICVATVTDIRQNSFLIHFDGWDKNYDYWAEADSTDLHPLGYMESHAQHLQPPNNYSKTFDWATYLQEVSAQPVPFEFFTEKQKDGTGPDKTVSVCAFLADPSKNVASSISLVTAGMRLEALDRQNPSLICVATVVEVKQNTLIIHFDGWGSNYDYWAAPDSTDLHPLGYMEKHGRQLLPPNNYSKTFDWATYLKEVSAQPVPFEFFTEKQKDGTGPEKTLGVCASLADPSKNVLGKMSLVAVGMRLEAVDRLSPSYDCADGVNPTFVCVATVADVKQNSIRIHFDGWESEYDYWAEHDSTDLRPVGYMDARGRSLSEPESYVRCFDWTTYLHEVSARPVPFEFFTEEQKEGTRPDKMLSVNAFLAQPSKSVFPDTTLVTVGMRLEAVDRQHPTLVCVATIIAVRTQSVLIHFDGWDDSYDYWAESNSSDLHPVGYTEHHGKKLEAPKDYGKKFEWTAYLQEVSARPVPFEFFTEEQKAGTKPDKTVSASATLGSHAEKKEGDTTMIEVGMRLEAKDRVNPIFIGVVTVSEVRQNSLLIHFDGWLNNFDYWAKPDSTDLHPVGYVESHDGSLYPPGDYDEDTFDWTTYLKEVSAKPVPFEFFTQAQKDGTKPDKIQEVNAALGLNVGEKETEKSDSKPYNDVPLSPHGQEGHGSQEEPPQVVTARDVNVKPTENHDPQNSYLDDVPPAFEYSSPGKTGPDDKAHLLPMEKKKADKTASSKGICTLL